MLLKLEQEGSIASEWGASDNNRKARFYKLTRQAQAIAGRSPPMGTDRGDHRTIFRREGAGPEMKALRRFFRG